MRNILIYGIESFLGSHVAAACLRMSDDRIFYLLDASAAFSEEEIIDLVSHASCQFGDAVTVGGQAPSLTARLHRTGREIDVHALRKTGGFTEVWCFANCTRYPNRGEVERLISTCRAIGVKEFNYVEYKDGSNGRHPDESSDRVELTNGITDEEISQWCSVEKIGYRIFRTSWVLGKVHPRLQQAGMPFLQFLSVLHSFKAEIEERSPQYFDFHALRCFVPDHVDAGLNLIAAVQAARSLLRIARTEGTTGSSFSVARASNILLSSLCECIGAAYGLGILLVENLGDLNAVDRALHERSGAWLGQVIHATPELQSGDFSTDDTSLDEETQIEVFESVRRNQDEALAAYRRRVASLAVNLSRKTVIRHGTELPYYVGGAAGSAVVLLNALGQGLKYWYRLMDNLMEKYRVIIWEARGTISPLPPFGLVDQVDDVDAILEDQGIERCHLVAWCTGPKVAIDFYLRCPWLIRSMVFMNSTFKCDGSPAELDSPYEQNLESLSRMLVNKPARAASVMRSLQSPPEENEIDILNGQDREAMSVSVLSRMNVNLRSHVLAPFTTEVTTLNYAHQLVDFWSHDSRAKAAEVRIPVLLIGTEYDQVATPASSHMASKLFPNARHLHVRAATHYCLYDRPDFVAGLLRTFFENSSELPATQSMQNTAAQAQ